ncbi:MAG: VWA domain-containing protein [Bdellovibrionales bacterium]|nr:VWA domain-containing protein [Bdellovibrionales bacterium]
MDIGESIFRAWLDRRKHRTEVRLARDEVHAARLALKDESAWLTSLAALLTGTSCEIRGGNLYDELPASYYSFPDELVLFADRALNRSVLLLRLLHLVEAEQQALYLPVPTAGLLDQLIFALLSEHLLVEGLGLRFPGSIALRQNVSRPLLETRRRLEEIRTVEDCIEAAVQQRLGAERDDALALPDTRTEELLQRLLDRPGRGELGKRFVEATTLANALVRRRKPRPEPLVIWPVLARSVPEEIVSDRIPEGKGSPDQKQVVELSHSIRRQDASTLKKPDTPVFHSFEATESIEDFQGESNEPETADNLDADAEALEDLKLGYTIRTFEDTPGLLRADITDDPAALIVEQTPAEPGRSFYYDEWDFRRREYRRNWCRVYENSATAPPRSDAASRISDIVRRTRPQIDDIRSELLRLLTTRTIRNRQTDGPEIDIDAMVERHADLAAGTTPPERLYLSPRKVIKDIALLLLLDTSLSTDSWVEGRRVLDVEIEALVILASAFDGLFDEEIAVAHFSSRTRNDCRYTVLKSFSDSWSQATRACSGLESFGYTRMGPAIRHATKTLKEVRAKKKFLVVVSDGKPTDYDQYEGRYGIRDVAQAVREARQLNITTFGLAVEYQPKLHFAEMFGAGRFRILPRTDLLPGHMAALFIEAVRP